MNIKFYFDNKKSRYGINYQDYALKMGITLESFSRIIHGHRIPQKRIAKRFEEVTNGDMKAEDVILFCWRHKRKRIMKDREEKSLQVEKKCQEVAQA